MNSPNKGQWGGALMLSLICAWINSWVNNGEAGDFRRHCAHYDSTVMPLIARFVWSTWDPPGPCRPQMGPMLAHRTLLSGYEVFNASKVQIVLNSKCISIELQRLVKITNKTTTNDYKQLKVTRLIYTWVALIYMGDFCSVYRDYLINFAINQCIYTIYAISTVMLDICYFIDLLWLALSTRDKTYNIVIVNRVAINVIHWCNYEAVLNYSLGVLYCQSLSRDGRCRWGWKNSH